MLDNVYKSIDVALSNIGSMSHQLTCRHCPISVQCHINWHWTDIDNATSQLMWHWTGWTMSSQLMWHWTDWTMLQVNWCDIEPVGQCHINWLVVLSNIGSMSQVNWLVVLSNIGSMSHQLTCRHWTDVQCHKSIDLWHCWTILQVNWCDIEPMLDNMSHSIDNCETLSNIGSMLHINWLVALSNIGSMSHQLTCRHWTDCPTMMWHWTDIGQCYKSIDL